MKNLLLIVARLVLLQATLLFCIVDASSDDDDDLFSCLDVDQTVSTKQRTVSLANLIDASAATALCRQSMQYCLNGDYAAAIQPLENCLKIPGLLKHQEARLLVCLGTSYCQEYQCSKAVSTLEKALTYAELTDAGRNTSIYYLASSHFYLRNYAIASELFKYTIANPNIPSEVKQRAYAYQGISYHQMKNHAVAVDSFRAALAMQGSIEVDSLNYNLGISLFGMKNYDEAIDPLFNASQSSTLNARYKSNAKICLAECYLKGSLCR